MVAEKFDPPRLSIDDVMTAYDYTHPILLVGYGDVAEIAAKKLREALNDFDAALSETGKHQSE